MSAMTAESAIEYLTDLAARWDSDPFEVIDSEGMDGREFLAVLRFVLAKWEDRRARLRDADNDLLEIRGILSPNPSAGEGIPAEVCNRLLGKRAAPAVEWLLADWERLAEENARLTEQLAEACGQRDRALAELAELRTVRRCGFSGPHPAHGWFFARKILRCPGVEAEAPTVTGPGLPQEDAQRGQEAPCGPEASPSEGRTATQSSAAPRESPPYGVGECAVCGEVRNLTKAGALRVHSGDIWIAGHRQICLGSGEPPKGAPVAD